MAKMVVGFQFDAQLYERLRTLKQHVSTLLRFNENSLGVQPMLGLLLDHWEQSPPSIEWLTIQAGLYPKRGRPRKSDPAAMDARVAMRKTFDKGHELIWRKIDEGKPYRIYYCKNCTMGWSTWDFPTAPAGCPKTQGFSSLYTPKVWKKSDLLLEGFTAEEVGWAAE